MNALTSLSSTSRTVSPRAAPGRSAAQRRRHAAAHRHAPSSSWSMTANREDAAAPRQSSRPRRAAHQLGQLPRDRQAQASAAIAARHAGFDLVERLEQAAESCQRECRYRCRRCARVMSDAGWSPHATQPQRDAAAAVNLIALLTRFMTIRRSLSSSPWTSGDRAGNPEASKRSAMPFAVAFAWKV